MVGATRREPLSFLQLPEDLQTRILAGLSTEQRMNCIPLVCKQLAELASRPGALWAEIRLWGKGRGDGSQDALQPLLKSLRARGALTKGLDLYPEAAGPAFFGPIMLAPLFPFLEKLSLGCMCYMVEKDLVAVQQACKRLNSLRVDNIEVSDGVLGSFLACYSFTNLRLDLQLKEGAKLLYFKEILHQQVRLETLELVFNCHIELPPTLPACLPNLKYLRYDSPGCERSGLPSTLSCSQRLTNLALTASKWTTVFPLVARLTGLSSLELEVYEKSTLDSVRGLNKLSKLTRLHITEFEQEVDSDEEEVAVANFSEEEVVCAEIRVPSLRSLELEGTALGAWVDFNGAGCLESASFVRCLFSSSKLRVSGLTRLTSLVLHHIPSVVVLDWPCVPQLQSLSLSNCEVGSFAPLEAARHLTSFNLSSIRRLKLDLEAVGVLCGLTKLHTMEVCQCGLLEDNTVVGRQDCDELFVDDRTLHYLESVSAVLASYKMCERCRDTYEQLKHEARKHEGWGF